MLKRHVNQLGPNVYAITVSDGGELKSVSTNPDDDGTLAFRYPHYPEPLDACDTLRRSELIEVDRLGPCVDVVRHVQENSETSKLVVFKYSVIWQQRQQIWDEMHIVKSLSKHPPFVSFDRIIIDDVESRVLGFTESFIPGGTLNDDPTKVLLFSWLQELTAAVDALNLQFGIIHQDIAPRNLIIDPVTDQLKIFDFDRAARVGSDDEREERNDVDGVIFTVYELFTLDDQYRCVPFDEQDARKVEEMEVWPVKRPFENRDGGITAYRSFLHEWATSRRTTRTIKHNSEAPERTYIDWPPFPQKRQYPLSVGTMKRAPLLW